MKALAFLLAPLLLVETATCLRVALHAQVHPSHGVLTTHGMKQALLEAGHDASVFYPFSYEGLIGQPWDVVIIEGYFESISSFIHEARRQNPGNVVVLFYCLDIDFPGLSVVEQLDVDGILANSERVVKYFGERDTPSRLVPLAVDPVAFPFFRRPPLRRVVYVGAAGALSIKKNLKEMLLEAAEFGLDIYGSGWQDAPDPLSQFWRGVLPQHDLARVYGEALAVIGVTMDGQRDSGAINNRVFEALATGAVFISDSFPELESLFGDLIFYYRKPGDISRVLESLLQGNPQIQEDARVRRRMFIEAKHTWRVRTLDQIDFAMEMKSRLQSRCTTNRRRGRGCPSLALVADHELTRSRDVVFLSSFFAAIEDLSAVYNIEWLDSETPLLEVEWDIIWAIGQVGGSADMAVRHALGVSIDRSDSRQPTFPQLRGFVLWESFSSSLNDADPSSTAHRLDGFYDFIVSCTDFDLYRTLQGISSSRTSLDAFYQQAWGVADFFAGERSGDYKEIEEQGDVAYYDCIGVGRVSYLAASAEKLIATCQGLSQRSLLAVVISSMDRPSLARFVPELQDSSIQIGDLPRLLRGTGSLDLLLLRNESYEQDCATLEHYMDLPAKQRETIIVGPIEAADSNLALWIATLAARHSKSISGYADSPQLREFFDEWTHLHSQTISHYSQQLMMAVSRGLCLGRGSSLISFPWVIDGEDDENFARASVPLRPPVCVPIVPRIRDFHPGRDGQWCLTVENQGTMCAQRADVAINLDLTVSRVGYDMYRSHRWRESIPLLLGLHLQGNIYGDLINSSSESHLWVSGNSKAPFHLSTPALNPPAGQNNVTWVSVQVDVSEFFV